MTVLFCDVAGSTALGEQSDPEVLRALRACRSAVQMRDTFAELGIEGRIGVNTGEVVTGTEDRLATWRRPSMSPRVSSRQHSRVRC